MKVYISGPMTGIPQSNFPAFDEAAETLRGLGYEVVSPAELDDAVDRELALLDKQAVKTWGDFLARDVKIIADTEVHGVVLLPGWLTSKGARLEAMVGLLCGLSFYVYHTPGLAPNLIRQKYVAHDIARTFL